MIIHKKSRILFKIFKANAGTILNIYRIFLTPLQFSSTKKTTTIYKFKRLAPLLYHNKHIFSALNLQTLESVTIILRFPKKIHIFPKEIK
ncbi:hypothetical protein HMPREF9396_1465 [Streptococcus sanguinis SK1059]|nr:hypothetical protein HMPREF9396_1465 [Streptococcus sanguinis SK1059]EGQ19390.1 hypothetical protein HMPREF8573_1456 [Streptococcus sanguinis ATCC 29667]EGQ22777.1 hypothetical protein HMPREF9387_2007 [Streptococcus sanguinis SK340]